MQRVAIVTAFIAALVSAPLAAAERPHLRLATTTSTENSGLLRVLHPPFERQTGIRVDVIAVGTGKALRLARNCDVDAVLVHAPDAERRFMQAGFGIDRRAVMHNDFVILGPEDDPAAVGSATSAADALRRIATVRATFVSRGDDSGTHKKERALWQAAGVEPAGEWYLSVGQGMGATLRIADDKRAYTLSDRGTWLAQRGQLAIGIRYAGDPALHNPYHVMAVNPARCPHARIDLARRYLDYLVGPKAQSLIAGYRVDGQALFHPDALPAAGARH